MIGGQGKASTEAGIPGVLSISSTLCPLRQNQGAHWLRPDKGLPTPLLSLLQKHSHLRGIFWRLPSSPTLVPFCKCGLRKSRVYRSFLDTSPTVTAEASNNPRILTGPPPRIPSCKRNNKPHLCPCSGGNMTWCFWNSGTVTRTLRFKFRFRIQLILSTREGKRAKTEGKYPYGQSCLYLFQNKLSWIPEFTCCESVSGLWHAPWCVKYTWWGCCLQKWEVILRDLGKR